MVMFDLPFQFYLRRRLSASIYLSVTDKVHALVLAFLVPYVIMLPKQSVNLCFTVCTIQLGRPNAGLRMTLPELSLLTISCPFMSRKAP